MWDKIQAAALAAYPKEAVWIVTGDEVHQVDNVHEDPFNFFRVSLEDTVKYQRKGITAVLHSHCNQAAVPSKDDMVTQILLGIPFGVVSVDGQSVSQITWWGEKEIPALEGRPFIHGVSDCYSVVRDYYRLQGKALQEVPRDWLWWESEDLISRLFLDVGFVPVDAKDAVEGDAWIAQVRGKTPHHCGILLDNDTILHHPGSTQPMDFAKISIIEPIYRYLPYITKFLRLV